MSLHPIRALDHVIAEYRDYLRTEFRAKDPKLRAALERELDAPRFLAQEPFYQAHRPFKQGKLWSELPIDREARRGDGGPDQAESGLLPPVGRDHGIAPAPASPGCRDDRNR